MGMQLRSLSFRVPLFAGLATAAVFSVGVVVLTDRVARAVEEQTHALQSQTTTALSEHVAQVLVQARQVPSDVASAFAALRSRGVTDRTVYDAVLEGLLADNPKLLATWSAWAPNALDGRDADFAGVAPWDATGRYVPYWHRGGGDIALEMLIDYDVPGVGDYALLPRDLDRAVALEPYPYMVGGVEVLITSFAVPIKVDGTYVGTAGIDLSLVGINDELGQLKPFETGSVALVSATGIVVAHPDPARVGTTLPEDDPLATVARRAADNRDVVDAQVVRPDGASWRYMARSFAAGDTQDRWTVVSMVPEATLMATASEIRRAIVGLSALSVLGAVAVIFLLMMRLVGRPLDRLGKVVATMSGGRYDVGVPFKDRSDEIGTIARSVEVFRENGLRVAEMTEAEAARVVKERDDRARMMRDLRSAFGDVVDAAVEGDLSRRVHAQFPDPEMNALAGSVNKLVGTMEEGLSETGKVLAALADTDLTKRVEGQYAGAFDKLKADTNAVADRLGEIVGRLQGTSRTLRSATAEMLAGANDLSGRTSDQAATIEQTSAAMEQLARTVSENARQVESASRKADEVSQSAEGGGALIQEANGAMARITESSSQISVIIGMIDDIAFQTSLLALNASVEAARAGEAGKGFAVVAVEVRRLAQSAAQASSDVKALIEQSGAEVAVGSRLVAEAAERLSEVLLAVRENTTLLGGIARGSRQQACAIDEVNVAVRQLDEMTHRNVSLVEEMHVALKGTGAQASDIDRVVDVFRLSPDAPSGHVDDGAANRAARRWA